MTSLGGWHRLRGRDHPTEIFALGSEMVPAGSAWRGWVGTAARGAVGVFLGLALPPLSSLLKPLLVPAIVGPFLIADPAGLAAARALLPGRGRPSGAALAAVVSPLCDGAGAAVRAAGLDPRRRRADGGGAPTDGVGALALLLGLDAPSRCWSRSSAPP